jgi:hypothetical protein
MKKKYTLILIVSLLSLALFATASFGWDCRYDIVRLNKEAPAISVYKGANAVVWLDDNNYKMLSDGTMEHNRRCIIMLGERIPREVRELRLPVPENGSVDVEEASWYDPMTAFKEGNLEVIKGKLSSGGHITLIRTPDEAIGRAVVLNYTIKYPRRYGADGAVKMAGPLPRWEQNLTVEVPFGLHLYNKGVGVKKPTVTKEIGTDIYTWTVTNQEPWVGEGFVEDRPPTVYFGFQKGILNSLKAVNEYAKPPYGLPLPGFVSGLNPKDAGLKLMQWMTEPEKTLVGFPRSWVRPQDAIPAEGPWTVWEKTIILNMWLNKLGWKSSLWWGSETIIDSDGPATADIWTDPVLLIEEGDERTYYQAGQRSAYGILSPEVIGLFLYQADGGSVEYKKVGSGSSSENKFALDWNLKLLERGTALGTLSITATGGWTEIISRGSVPEVSELASLLNEKINFALPGMALVPTKIAALRNGYRMDFNVKCAPGISHGGNILLRLPGGVPPAAADIMEKRTSYRLRFPFIIEQKVRMKTPAGYKLMQKPPLANITIPKKSALKESMVHWPKKGELIAESIWVVKTTEIDRSLAFTLRDQLTVTMRWPVLDLPFKK